MPQNVFNAHAHMGLPGKADNFKPLVLSYTGWLRQCWCILVKNTTFDNNFVNVMLNVTKFGMLIDNISIDMPHDFGCYGNNFGGKL